MLPKITILDATTTNRSLSVLGFAELVEDDINTYIYTKIMRQTQGPLGQHTPVESATLRLMDQDTPKPAGDDAVNLPPLSTHIIQTGKVVRVVTRTFQPNESDQELAQETTDVEGKVLFILAPFDLLTTAGKTKTKTVYIRLDTRKTQVVETTSIVAERYPDIYLLITPASEAEVDSRKLANPFFFKNLSEKQVGSKEEPVTIILPPLAPENI